MAQCDKVVVLERTRIPEDMFLKRRYSFGGMQLGLCFTNDHDAHQMVLDFFVSLERIIPTTNAGSYHLICNGISADDRLIIYLGAPHMPPGHRSSGPWFLGFGTLGIGGLVGCWLVVSGFFVLGSWFLVVRSYRLFTQ